MKLLLDECMDQRTGQALMSAGHEVLSVAQWQPGASDQTILDQAYRTQRILVTLDKDFGRLAVAESVPHCGILRLTGFSSREEPQACLAALGRFALQLERGALVVFEPDRSRVRESG